MKVVTKKGEKKVIISNYCCIKIMLDFCKDMKIDVFNSEKCKYCGRKIEFDTDAGDENYLLLKSVNF